jgi:hypothetical protein
MKRILTVCALLVFVAGCVRKEPEGPAEQIGKGIDQVTRGIKQYETDTASQPSARARPDTGALSDSIRSAPTIDDSIPEGWESYEEWQQRKRSR